MERRRDSFHSAAIFALLCGVAGVGILAAGGSAAEHSFLAFAASAAVAIPCELMAWRNQVGLLAEQRHKELMRALHWLGKQQNGTRDSD